MSNDDRRQALYRDFHEGQHQSQLEDTRRSASRVFDILSEYAAPASVLDVGCGLGTWLAVARDRGISDVRGVEGPWIDRAKLAVDPALVEITDLEQGFALNRSFDLVICSEVAEHLAPAAAPKLIESLCQHGNLILFSAAIPLQGGHYHVNEQFLDYWIKLFEQHSFVPIDLFRPRIWYDATVLWWLRQNLVLFASPAALASNPKLAEQKDRNGILSIVYPGVYLDRARTSAEQVELAQRWTQLMALVRQHGRLTLSIQGDQVSITKV